MWGEIIKGLFSAGFEIYEAIDGAKEEEQQHAYEFMTGMIAAMRSYGADLKGRILKRNEESIAKAKQQAAELAGNDGA